MSKNRRIKERLMFEEFENGKRAGVMRGRGKTCVYGRVAAEHQSVSTVSLSLLGEELNSECSCR